MQFHRCTVVLHDDHIRNSMGMMLVSVSVYLYICSRVHIPKLCCVLCMRNCVRRWLRCDTFKNIFRLLRL